MPANRKNLLLAAGLFLLAGALHEAEILLPSALRSPCFLAVTLLYLGLSLGWAASIAQRIMHRAVRRLLIACAALAALWIVLRTCKYRFFDSEAVCLMLWYFYYLPQLFAPVLMLLAALHLGRREEEAVSPRWYLLLAPAAGRLSPCALILAMAAMAAVLAVALLRLRAWQRDHLSAASVKEGLDQLPAGLCFYVRDGLPRLVNMRMDALCCALTGSPLMNGEVFWQRLCAGDVVPGCEVLAASETPILRTPDGRVWSFVRSGIRVGGQSARQIVASDVTQEHAMNRQLHEDNRRVAQLNLRLRRYGEQIR